MQLNGSEPSDVDAFDYIGEVVWIPESLVVSPARGRFRREQLEEGSMITSGTVIGNVATNGHSTPIASTVDGVFLGWLAWEGESLQRGTPLARIGSEPGTNGAAPSRNGSPSPAKKRRRPDDGKDR